MAATFFELSGYQILTAENAEDALRQSRDIALGAVILDVNLPGEGSALLLAALKQSHPQTPVILYTGRTEDDEVVRAMLDQGADRYLLKDGSLEKVLQTVQAVCA
ncbi:MAG: two component transcriptional regulator, winged helix family [Pedosphaera sp.]|nr:two component transcriptional regulator, winged helix family [Pedosphaera sp.]